MKKELIKSVTLSRKELDVLECGTKQEAAQEIAKLFNDNGEYMGWKINERIKNYIRDLKK